MNKTHRSKILDEIMSEAYKDFIKDNYYDESELSPEVQEFLDKRIQRGIFSTSLSKEQVS